MCINTSMPTLRQYEVSLEHMTFKIGLKQPTRAESSFRESKKDCRVPGRCGWETAHPPTPPLSQFFFLGKKLLQLTLV